VAEAAGLADPSRLRWTVEAVDHESIIDTTGGLFDVRGYGHDGDAPAEWSCVVKALERSEGGECDPPDSWCYWRREAAFYSSDLYRFALQRADEAVSLSRQLGLSEAG